MPNLVHHLHGYLLRLVKPRSKMPEMLIPTWQIHCPPEHQHEDAMVKLLPTEEESQLRLQNNNNVLSETITVPDTVPAENFTSQIAHPWPEWVDLMKLLLKKGYFNEIGNPFADTELSGKASNLIRTACLNFGRDRFDIMRYLSRKDIQDAVGSGCPGVDRKMVNSGKRLRAYLGLDEANTCSSCCLRGECDRAYIKARETEGAATTDVMRILLTFGLDPIGESMNKSCQKQSVKDSVKKLLKEMVKFAEMENGQNLSEQDCPTHQGHMQPGDWICRRCSFMNFEKNIRCLGCNLLLEEKLKTKNEAQDHLPQKKGDWICEKCSFLNFAKNSKCLQCHENPPMSRLSPGDWHCPSCNYLNFGRNMVCKRCDHRRPKASSPSDEAAKDYMGNHVFNESRSISSAAEAKYQLLATEKRQRKSKSSSLWNFVETEFISQERIVESTSSDNALEFMDFPIAGGKSELSRDRGGIEKWKLEMVEKKTIVTKVKESEIATMPDFVRYDDEELDNSWFGRR